jgi:hypothetical protein
MAKDPETKRGNTADSADEAARTKSGRVASDDRGCSTWEWRLVTEASTRVIDTYRARQLPEEAAVTLKEEEPPPPPVGVDPYSVTAPLAPENKPRRTLDDMRKLSEEIKRSRQPK